MKKNRSSAKQRLSFRIIKWLIWLFSPKMKTEGLENLPDGPCIIVANHAQMMGPIFSEVYLPEPRFTWCASQMMHLKEVPAYAFEDFWSSKPKFTHWFYRLLSYVIAPFSVFLFNNARTIPVYRDARLITTFRKTIEKLQEGARIVIFPECYIPHNNIIYSFQDKFIDLAGIYFKKTGCALSFVPMYIAPSLKKACIGKPIQHNAAAPLNEERSRICSSLMDEITSIARSLPQHLVTPYPNVSRREYPFNIPKEVNP